MARSIETRLVDDLDGSDADETVTFSFEGREYEIDLSDDNAARLRNTLAVFVAAARRAENGRSGGRAHTLGSRRPAAVTDHKVAIRSRASANGHDAPERGRLPRPVTPAPVQREAVQSKQDDGPIRKRSIPPSLANPFTV
jgi:nucleoid-associated protein Lsr2